MTTEFCGCMNCFCFWRRACLSRRSFYFSHCSWFFTMLICCASIIFLFSSTQIAFCISFSTIFFSYSNYLFILSILFWCACFLYSSLSLDSSWYCFSFTWYSYDVFGIFANKFNESYSWAFSNSINASYSDFPFLFNMSVSSFWFLENLSALK